jgi:hypothetical protein
LDISIGVKGMSMWTTMLFTCHIACLRNIKVVSYQQKLTSTYNCLSWTSYNFSSSFTGSTCYKKAKCSLDSGTDVTWKSVFWSNRLQCRGQAASQLKNVNCLCLCEVSAEAHSRLQYCCSFPLFLTQLMHFCNFSFPMFITFYTKIRNDICFTIP